MANPARQFISWAKRVHYKSQLRAKVIRLRGMLIDDESGAAVALDEIYKYSEQLRRLLERERKTPGKRRQIEHDLAEVINGIRPLLAKLRRTTRGRMPEMRELAGEILDLLDLLEQRL